MSKKFSIFLSALFCSFLGGMLIVSILLPDQEFSQLENRYLQQLPKLSWEAVESGKFMSDAEDYVSDHLLGRDLWVSMKSWCERLTGKQENNGVYFAQEGTLINRVTAPDMSVLEKNMSYVDKLAENLSVPVHFGLIPSAAEIWADRLPAGAPTADEQEIIDHLYSLTQAIPLPLGEKLVQHAQEEIYYRTDHHWTSLGAYYGYQVIAESLGLTASALEDLTPVTVTEDFNGTIFSSSGVRWVEPDSIQTYIPDEGIKVTNYFDGTPTEGSLYAPEYLDKKDKYSYFLGGVQPLCTIETEHTDAPKLLLIRDSYSDSLAPFLTKNFSEIHLWDLRFNSRSIQQYVEEEEIDQVIVLYSISNFLSDKNLFLLGR